MTDFGTVRRDGSFGAVRFERVYAATPEELWDAWTSPERIPRWLGASLVGTLAAGSTARLVWGEDADSQVELLVQEHKPPRLLEWQWTITRGAADAAAGGAGAGRRAGRCSCSTTAGCR